MRKKRIKKKHVIEEIETSKKTEQAIDDMVTTVQDELDVDEIDAKEFVKNYVIGSDINEFGKDKVHTAKFDRCVADVKKHPKKLDNPYSICQASLGADAIKKSHRKKEEEDYTNETTVSITKGKLLETILNKKPRRVVKTIRIGDLKK